MEKTDIPRKLKASCAKTNLQFSFSDALLNPTAENPTSSVTLVAWWWRFPNQMLYICFHDTKDSSQDPEHN